MSPKQLWIPSEREPGWTDQDELVWAKNEIERLNHVLDKVHEERRGVIDAREVVKKRLYEAEDVIHCILNAIDVAGSIIVLANGNIIIDRARKLVR